MLVEVYSRNGCGTCLKAKNWLLSNKVPYTEYLVGEDITVEETKEMFPGVNTLPIVKVDGVFVGGYTQLIQSLRGRLL
ncbi:MAG: glutaredoxin [Legionella sp.]|uniref:glutaredoxin family protein n=1 Tax=Legionella sp. TaxID=459 RepID=UPI00283DA6C9|nr:glutaredoxin [Legionella sp.]